eukprot:scaffold281481_cov32-Tisochrysis_lutea.AAC.3
MPAGARALWGTRMPMRRRCSMCVGGGRFTARTLHVKRSVVCAFTVWLAGSVGRNWSVYMIGFAAELRLAFRGGKRRVTISNKTPLWSARLQQSGREPHLKCE